MTDTNQPEAHAAPHVKMIAEVGKGDHYRCIVTFEFETKATPAPHETIEHEPCDEVRELTWGVELLNMRKHRDNMTEWWSRVATLDELHKELPFAVPAERRDIVAELLALGTEWHLNGLKAGCAHQTVVWEQGRYGQRQPSLTLTQPCPETGYKYGHAWLARPLGEGVEERVCELLHELQELAR